MTFTCTWMNRLDQFGYVDIDLLIINDDSVIPTQKVCKSYDARIITRDEKGEIISTVFDYGMIDEAFLTSEAEKIVEQVVYDYENPLVVEEVV